MKFWVSLVVVVSVVSGCASQAKRPVYDKSPYFSISPTGQASTPLGNSNSYRIFGVISDNAVSDAIAWLTSRSSEKEVTIEINSPGGSVFAGFELAKAIETKGPKVKCIVDGLGASMAFYILQSCQVREMTKRSVLMVHQPSSGMDGSGDADEYQDAADFLRSLTRAMLEHCAARMKISADALEARVAHRSWYMDYREALLSGAVDTVI